MPEFLRLGWTFFIYSVTLLSATALLSSNWLSSLTFFPWLIFSFPLHCVCSDCPIKPAMAPQVDPHLAAFPCSHLRLFAVQSFLSSCTTLRKGQSGRGQQNSVFNLLCRIPLGDPNQWIWSLKQVHHIHMYRVFVCEGKKQLTISCVRNHLGKVASGNRTGSRN